MLAITLMRHMNGKIKRVGFFLIGSLATYCAYEYEKICKCTEMPHMRIAPLPY